MAWVFVEGARFYLHEGESVLAGMLRHSIPCAYECKRGYCGACRMRIRCQQGAIFYLRRPLFGLAPGDILPCVACAEGVLVLDDP